MAKRYEFYGWTEKQNPSTKYWQIKKEGNGMIAEWGKIGRKQGSMIYSFEQGLKKIREKEAKGYKHVSGSID